jgi:hypothetical protein
MHGSLKQICPISSHVLALEGILAEQYFEGIGPPCILICTLFAESSYSWFGSCKTIDTNAITRGGVHIKLMVEICDEPKFVKFSLVFRI